MAVFPLERIRKWWAYQHNFNQPMVTNENETSLANTNDGISKTSKKCQLRKKKTLLLLSAKFWGRRASPMMVFVVVTVSPSFCFVWCELWTEISENELGLISKGFKTNIKHFYFLDNLNRTLRVNFPIDFIFT